MGETPHSSACRLCICFVKCIVVCRHTYCVFCFFANDDKNQGMRIVQMQARCIVKSTTFFWLIERVFTFYSGKKKLVPLLPSVLFLTRKQRSFQKVTRQSDRVQRKLQSKAHHLRHCFIFLTRLFNRTPERKHIFFLVFAPRLPMRGPRKPRMSAHICPCTDHIPLIQRGSQQMEDTILNGLGRSGRAAFQSHRSFRETISSPVTMGKSP